MKYISFLFPLFFILCIANIHSQRSVVNMVYGNGENISKSETWVISKPNKITLQIFENPRKKAGNATIGIVELNERFYCDSLGNVTIEIPDSMFQLGRIRLTILRRIGINYGCSKNYTKRIVIQTHQIFEKKKVILSSFKKIKSYHYLGGCPSF